MVAPTGWEVAAAVFAWMTLLVACLSVRVTFIYAACHHVAATNLLCTPSVTELLHSKHRGQAWCEGLQALTCHRFTVTDSVSNAGPRVCGHLSVRRVEAISAAFRLIQAALLFAQAPPHMLLSVLTRS